MNRREGKKPKTLKTLVPFHYFLSFSFLLDCHGGFARTPSCRLSYWIHFVGTVSHLEMDRQHHFPRGYKIPTLCPNHSLTVTSDMVDDKFQMNGVEINGFSIYYNGSLIIFEINKFLDPHFEVFI